MIEDEGTKNSGNWGYKGRKGQIGGSSPYGGGNYSFEDFKNILDKKRSQGITQGKKLLSNFKEQVKNKLSNNKELQNKLNEFKNRYDTKANEYVNSVKFKNENNIIEKFEGGGTVKEKEKKRIKEAMKLENKNLSKEEQEKIALMSNKEYKDYKNSFIPEAKRQEKLKKIIERNEAKRQENAEFMKDRYKNETFNNEVSKKAIEGTEEYNRYDGKKVFIPNKQFWDIYKDNKEAIKQDFNVRKYEYNDYTKNNWDKDLYNLVKKKSLGWYLERK